MFVSVLVTLLAMPASIWGNELAIRHGRHRAITVIQIASASVAISIGLLSGSASWALLMLVLVYAITVPADSGALTAGMSASAEPRFRGVTLALHSTVGFGLSAWRAGWWASPSMRRWIEPTTRLDGGLRCVGRRCAVWARCAAMVCSSPSPNRFPAKSREPQAFTFQRNNVVAPASASCAAEVRYGSNVTG